MTAGKQKAHNDLASVRDTVESIWIAIVLAFVLRAFVVEAFVIPTGSMAPQLMGEHWDLVCPSCGWQYAFGDQGAGTETPSRRGPQTFGNAQCPNCGFAYPAKGELTSGGDRVLVLKYLYHFSEPQPWDVVVFKNPQNNQDNYIKRLIGVPGETIEIIHGDVFFKSPATGEKWAVRRKTHAAQEAMWQVLLDNDYQSDSKWAQVGPIKGLLPVWKSRSEAWDMTGDQGRVFAFAGAKNWQELYLDASREAFLPRNGYNSRNEQFDREMDICSDLKLSAVFKPTGDDSAVQLMLTSFDAQFVAELSADGQVMLRQSSSKEPAPTLWRAQMPPLALGKGYDIALVHADWQVSLWINGKQVLSTGDAYSPDVNALKQRMESRESIPQPNVQIAASGGPCELWHVQVMRDVFYTSPSLQSQMPTPGPLGDYARTAQKYSGVNWANTPGWGVMGNPIHLANHPDNPDFDEFYMLGDNSSSSLDSRLWTSAAPSLRLLSESGQEMYTLGTVPRYAMMGRAMFVYWPSGFRPPGLTNLPLVPNVGKMRFIR